MSVLKGLSKSPFTHAGAPAIITAPAVSDLMTLKATHPTRSAASCDDSSPAGCGHCMTHGDPAPGALQGWRLAAVAGAAFLTPVIMAAVGAAVSPAGREPLGCILGLAVGAVAGWLIVRARRPGELDAEETP
ncbi:hypothetical protein LCGC14_0418720 [marine sediment metagenome]|uniref:Uncharacterized protein n=1 Tax=marine sediment metagenome TaxID=412755 RepID=A0A0F9SXJ4_9ZZZZ